MELVIKGTPREIADLLREITNPLEVEIDTEMKKEPYSEQDSLDHDDA